MKTLPKTFSKNGFEFEQLDRRGDLAIFRKHKKSRCVSYEVVRVQYHDAYEIAGKQIEAGECYPSSESWGSCGFTLPTYEASLKKLADMDAKQ
jgi:hypothetical protein